MGNTSSKIKDLRKFLRKQGIAHGEIIAGEKTKLVLTDKVYITTTGGFYKKHSGIGIDALTFELIKQYLVEITKSYAFDNCIGDEIEKQKIKTLLDKSNRSIKKDVKTHFVDRSRFGGFTDSRKSITLYEPSNEPVSRYLKIVPGISYHELGHILYTCSFSELMDDVRKLIPRYEPSFSSMDYTTREQLIVAVKDTINALEDGRMENLTGNFIGGAIPYFESTIYNFIIDSLNQRVDHGERINEFDLALVVGRKYIDIDVRKWIIDEYIKCDEEHTEEKAKRVVSYINKFITLSWTHNRQEMLELGLGFFFEFIKQELEKDSSDSLDKQVGDMMGDLGTESNTFDEKEDGAIDKSEEEMLKKVINDVIQEMKEGKGEDEESKGNQAGEGEKEDGDFNPVKIAKSKIKKANEEINKNVKDLEKKAKNTQLKNKKNTITKDYDVLPEMKRSKQLLEKALREFSIRCRNGYQTRKKRGTIDVGEVRRQSHKKGVKVFRQYKKNTSRAMDIDVAFCLDVSGSMSDGDYISLVHEASRQLWVASTACESVGANVKLFTFSSRDQGVIQQPKSKERYRVPGTRGGTYISDTMFLAENFLNTSKASNKWFIALTDGFIGDEGVQNQIIERMQRDGITCGKINMLSGGMKEYVYDEKSDTGGFNDESYDHSIIMHHDGSGRTKTAGCENIVTFFKRIFELSLKKVRV